MANVKVLPTRQFAASFRSFLAEGPTALTIVSPFLTPVKGWESLLQFSKFVLSRGTSKLEIVTCPPLNDNHGMERPNCITRKEAELIEAEGVSLKIRETNLHAKLYYFEFEEPARYAAFIGSSNFTSGGFERNDETMVRIEHPDDHSEVLREIARLSTNGSFPYQIWKSRKLTMRAVK
ncbi:NgoFVII family restriction endonuclease [Burkholderia multivorans]|uniref:phospholipase D family protein n=1 Tax=Burkholderia ubonensis TaxID=101571 RepID=UPI000F71953E|nr:phospholipase D family protein [Burkholderia ubonensis]AYZ66753.1 NgoFVII family restriction endonuclease [Burkholderia multivorans]